MILNATNSKAIQKVAKTPYIEKWSGVKIQIYTAKVSAFGEQVDALRIRTVAPKETSQPAPLPTITPDDISDAQFKLEAAETLDQLAAIYKALTPQMQAINEIKDLAVKLKSALTNANP